MALWPHLHQVHLGSGAAAPGKLPGKIGADAILPRSLADVKNKLTRYTSV